MDFDKTKTDWLSCDCGNKPRTGKGFDPCTQAGEIVELDDTLEKWDNTHYLCRECSAVVTRG